MGYMIEKGYINLEKHVTCIKHQTL